MRASAWSAAAGSNRPKVLRDRLCSTFPRLQNAAIAFAPGRGFRSKQGETGSDAARLFILDQRDQFHPLELVLVAIVEASPGNEPARAGNPRSIRRRDVGIALRRGAIMPGEARRARPHQ